MSSISARISTLDRVGGCHKGCLWFDSRLFVASLSDIKVRHESMLFRVYLESSDTKVGRALIRDFKNGRVVVGDVSVAGEKGL